MEHFTYWEKFDYWAVLWGTGLMGAAGLVLWFPVAASRLLPGWMFNVALFVHGAEATLAIGFIFVIHFFNGHLRPGKFPMDMVIFTGSAALKKGYFIGTTGLTLCIGLVLLILYAAFR